MQEMAADLSRRSDGRVAFAAAIRETDHRNSREQWRSKIMVWAFVPPSGFGQFAPRGECVGWRESCEAYFHKMPPEFQASFDNFSKKYIAFASRKFTEEFGVTPRYDPPLTPIEPHEVPTVYRTEKRFTKLGSILELPNMWIVVDQALKDIIERLEPGVHKFFPVKIEMTKKGTPYPVQYYLLVIGRFLDSFLPGQSAEGSWQFSETDPTILRPNVYGRKDYAGLAFSRDVIGSAHLWRERRLRDDFIYISDELCAEISKAGLGVWTHYHMHEV